MQAKRKYPKSSNIHSLNMMIAKCHLSCPVILGRDRLVEELLFTQPPIVSNEVFGPLLGI